MALTRDERALCHILPGTELFYDDQGEGRPPPMLVHGFTYTHEDWRFQVAYVRSRQRVVSQDLRGQSLSPSEILLPVQ